MIIREIFSKFLCPPRLRLLILASPPTPAQMRPSGFGDHILKLQTAHSPLNRRRSLHKDKLESSRQDLPTALILDENFTKYQKIKAILAQVSTQNAFSVQ